MKITSGLKSLLGFILVTKPGTPALAGLPMFSNQHPASVYRSHSGTFKKNLRTQRKARARRAYLRAQRG